MEFDVRVTTFDATYLIHTVLHDN